MITIMTEAQFKKKAIEKMQKMGWHFWFPPKVKFYERDIFGVFDFIAVTPIASKIILVQLTSISNLSKRRKKIHDFCRVSNAINIQDAFIWAWDDRKNDFYEEHVELAVTRKEYASIA